MIKRFITTIAIILTATFATAEEIDTHLVAAFFALETDAVLSCPTMNMDYIEENGGACFSWNTWTTNSTAKSKIELLIMRYADATWSTPWYAGGDAIARYLTIGDLEFMVMILDGAVTIYPPDVI